MNKLSLHTLGPFQAHLDSTPLTDFRTRKVQALLIYLATEPQAHNRDLLLELLWPGLPERSARSNLRQIIYYLRQLFPVAADNGQPVVIVNRQTIQLNPQAEVEVDAAQFQALVDRSKAHNHLDLLLCADCGRDLERAAALYQGDFLADFYLDDSNEYEEWAHARREHLRRQALDALAVLATMAVRQQNYPRAQAYARVQLAIDNLREGAYRQLMEALALSGCREEALAVYETCRRLLADELGMAPSARTTEYKEKITAGDLRFDRPAVQGVRGYELKEQIGKGGYGTIHRALQPVIGREVAIKVIRLKYANDPEFIRRFEAEAQIIARLEHPHIVPLYDYWRDPEGAYLVMRYIRQGSLLTALESGPWPLEQAASLLDQVAGALSMAHQQGVVHRDIKPANILIDEAGNAYLTDFGIARDLTREERVTDRGALAGSLEYVSPEQILGEPLSPQTDIYSLGAVLYETLTGEKPFAGAGVAGLLHSHLHEPIPPVTASLPGAPVAVDSVLQKATEKNPANRYASALAMAEAFRRAVRGQHPEMMGEPRPALSEVYNPYKGIRAFQEADAADFFGREALVQQLLDRLDGAAAGDGGRFLAVVGPSGSGKSSVVKAGLIPALRDGALPGSENWFITEMTPGRRPFESLELALWPVAVEPPPNLVGPMQRDTGGILRTIRRILPDAPGAQLLLVIDQFEELYTLVAEEVERAFFLDSLLTALTAPRSPLRLVATLRADFYDRPLHRQNLGQLLKDNTEIVLPLNPTELTWAICEPARRMGVILEEGLASAIVADVADQPGGLPLLQYAMTELFERRQDHLITRAAYQQIGGVQGALGRRAEAVYAELDEANQKAARQLFLRLVTLGEGTEDTRRRALLSELEDLNLPAEHEQSHSPPPAAQATISTVLNRFGAARFLTFDRDPLSRSPTVEVAHEALLSQWPRLRDWLAGSRRDVRMQRLLAAAAAEWQQAGQEAGYLLRGGRLDHFESWAAASSVVLTTGEQAFLSASLAARRVRRQEEESRRQRELETAQKLAQTERRRAEEQAQAAQRLRLRAAFLAGALVIVALLAVLALTFARSASSRQVEAQAHAELAAAREAEALHSAGLAAARQAEAEAEANLRATAEAIAIQERETAEQQQALAEWQARQAFSRELVASSMLNLEKDPELSILLALEALELADTFQAQEALHQALQFSLVLQRVSAGPGEFFGRVSASPDGARLAVGLHDPGGPEYPGYQRLGLDQKEYQTQVRDAETLELLYTLPGVSFYRWVDAGRLPTYAPGDDPDTILVTFWDAAGQPLSTALIPVAWHDLVCLYCPDISPDMAAVAISTQDGIVSIYDLSTGDRIHTLGQSGDPRRQPFFSPDGTLLAAAEHVGFELTLWEVVSGREILVRRMDFDQPTVCFSPDGKQIAAVDNKTVKIVDIASGEDVLSLYGHEGRVSVIACDPNGSRLVTLGNDNTLRWWDARTGQSLAKSPVDFAKNVVFTPDGSRVFTTNRNVLQVWGLHPAPWLVPGQGEAISGLAFSPDGSYLAIAQADERIWVVDALTGQTVKTLTSSASAIEAFTGHPVFGPRLILGFPAFSPDGRRLAALRTDNTAVVWDLASGEEALTLSGHEDLPWRVVFSPDGTRLATIGFDKTARLWDAASGAPIHVLNDIFTGTLIVGGNTMDIAFSPDGRILATAARSDIRFWDASTGEELLAWTVEGSGVHKISFSPDGSRLAAGFYHGASSGVWDVTSGEKVLGLSELSGMVLVIAYSPDGSQIATTSGDGTIRLWDAATGEVQLTLKAWQIDYAAYSPNGAYLAAQRLDPGIGGPVHLFPLRLEDLVELAHSRLTRGLTLEECRQYLHVEECPAE